MESTRLTLEAAFRGRFDLIVCGGGVAGCAAALEGARHGRKTLLVEQASMLGGLATIGLVNYFVPMCSRRGKAVCRGMAEEFLRLSISCGYSTLPDAWKDGEPEGANPPPYQTEFDPMLFGMLLADLLDEAGVNILFDAAAILPVMDGSRCAGVAVHGQDGIAFYEAGAVIDATGGASLLKQAGAPTEDGKNYFSYFPREITLSSCRDAAVSGEIRRALRVFPAGAADLYGRGHPEDVPFFRGASPDTVSDYLLRNQKLIVEKRRADPDCREKLLVTAPMMPQLRTTRRLVGDYTLCEADVFRHFPDSVAAVCDFDRADALFEIPLRCLTRRGFDNLVAAGRCVSAKDYAWDVVRVIPPAILTGQAAALIACAAADRAAPVWDADIASIQSALEKENAPVHFDDALLPSPDAVEDARRPVVKR